MALPSDDACRQQHEADTRGRRVAQPSGAYAPYDPTSRILYASCGTISRPFVDKRVAAGRRRASALRRADGDTSGAKPSRAGAYQWAELMRRTFGLEVLACFAATGGGGSSR
jgi:hypothetical protein